MSKRRELQQQRKQQDRKRNLIIMGVIALIAIVIVGTAIIAGNLTSSTSSTLPVVSSTKPIPVNPDPSFPAWGPADAPIKIQEFIDYQCPACGNYNKNFEAGVIEAFAKTNKVRYEIKFFPFLETNQAGGRESRDPAQAAMCALEQGKFWQMHNSLFENQAGENRGGFTKARLKDIAAKVGLDKTQFDTCLDSNRHEPTVLAGLNVARDVKVQSTPSFVINGKLFPGALSVADFRKRFAEIAPDIKVE
ncbi:MAG: thioredoxin domain-containing protein [Chloroflexota bacterium]|jgi:protein-disulfide isomerase|nr:thioredoxin domain-containing protein [Chloroflexota bacterium]